ncbi:MAG: hypothetical protein JOZ62_19925 [Acidobacteriaceae bacterium]|nr:hypothetical protein [Acidobacteriaceae bacterium]
MAEQKLNLFQLTARDVTKARTGAAKVVCHQPLQLTSKLRLARLSQDEAKQNG